ncbi:hypothetical protein F5884DRAFT_163041 [Xylogone sp. PMI_703]|nr:hypothetical protein F5884DRAFT_163041 [Xylogone sp. PMI_703]
MTKGVSARSSAQASPHPPSSRHNEDSNENQTSEEHRTSEAAAEDSRRPSSTEDSHISVDVDTAHARAPESQPMTTSTSASSNPPHKDTVGSSAPSTSAPYGTRSRNRTGIPRPNYAEDKELDNEIEVSTTSRDNVGRKGSRISDIASSASADSAKPLTHSRKSVGSEADQATSIQTHYKEPIPGTSTFSANPSAAAPHNPTSKKRKANGQPAVAVFQSQGQAQTSSTAHPATRRANTAAQMSGSFRESNMMTFDNCGGYMKDDYLVADDGTILKVNDHVYLVCEPPGEPYYLGRIMEFLHTNNDSTQPIDALRLNWYYRPKDIGRKVNDTRQVFASMHSDISPLTALRGKCQILHKSEVEKLDDLRKTRDSFWYEKLYDRYIHRFYDVIPTTQVINVPDDVKRVLDQRWKYIVVEPGRGKELTSAVKTCKRCSRYCASNDSVDCAVCDNTYHMSCVNPPLLKKPSRGFAWACGPCSKAQAKKIEARNTPNITDSAADADDDDFNDEEDDFPATIDGADTGRTSPTKSIEGAISIHPGTAEQIHQAGLWLFRYLGIHCKVEDALDYDDRIYPRASSRLGPRHQANVTMWPGRPVEYVKSTDVKRKYVKGGGHKKDTKLSKETLAALEADKIAKEKRPKWVMDEPPGYIQRGEDYSDDDPNSTATLLFKIPEADDATSTLERGTDMSEPEPLDLASIEKMIDDYMIRAKELAKPLGLPEFSTNLLDVAINMLQIHHFDTEKALDDLRNVDKGVFKEPELNPAEVKKFEDGVTKFGSEWHSIKKHVKTVSAADIVRFYYTWKKTDRGRQIWGNYSGRKGKKEAKRAEVIGKLQDDVADDFDDSAFDNEKAVEKKRGFQCKFCGTKNSRQWRRAPNTPAGTTVSDNSNGKTSNKDKSSHLMVALCWRCAELWRRYAIQWEDIEEVAKKVAQTGGRAYKRKIDEELLKELVTANEVMNEAANTPSTLPISANGTPAPSSAGGSAPEPGRKKLKGAPEKDAQDHPPEGSGVALAGQSKKKAGMEKHTVSAPAPEPPKPKPMPCAICHQMDPIGEQLTCKECRITVHRNCYGVMTEIRNSNKWMCDMCSNDKNPQISIQYKCMLCPVEHTVLEPIEPSKATNKKKSEKERERDRVEKEQAQKAAEFFRRKQEEMNKPVEPREPLKRTANNNWVHVTCAVFTPEVKFGNAKALEPSEGIPSIPSARYDETCKACKQKGGACVACHSCRAPVHVECAHQNGFVLGFDIAPVKGSRRDQFNIVNINGEVGTMTAAVWCKEHVPTKTIVHRMHDIVDDTGLNALQLYVRTFKQADLTLTGTVRKANLINQSTKVVNTTSTTAPSNRRTSTAAATNGHSAGGKVSASHVKLEDSSGESALATGVDAKRACVTCGVDVSPKWWPFPVSIVDFQSPISGDSSAPHVNGDTANINDPPLTNGHPVSGPLTENGGAHIAIAAAALHENTRKPIPGSTKYQCHQCHWKRGRKEPTPPTAPAPRELSRPPTSNGPTSSNGPGPDADIPQVVSTYSWAPSAPYVANGPYNWPRQSTTSQNGAVISSLSNGPAPRPASGQPLRQPSQPLPHSPHQNGHAPQLPNGYPPSPRHIMSSPSMHMANGGYAPYPSARPSNQPLTNGVPQPRSTEHTFGQLNAPVHSRPAYGPPHGSPPMLRDALPQQPRDAIAQPSTTRPTDGRVNGGASASPSLRNLLS